MGTTSFAFDAVDVETLRPPLENTMVDVVLSGRVGEGESEREADKFSSPRRRGGTR